MTFSIYERLKSNSRYFLFYGDLVKAKGPFDSLEETKRYARDNLFSGVAFRIIKEVDVCQGVV